MTSAARVIRLSARPKLIEAKDFILHGATIMPQLLLMTRETPLNAIHLEHMLKLSQMGVSIFPPMPAFYNHPLDLNEMIDHIAI